MKLAKYKTTIKADGKIGLLKERSYEVGEEKLDHSESIIEVMKEVFLLHRETEEYLYELCLDAKLNPVAIFEVSHGTVNAALISPREFFQKALLSGAVGVVAIHNHPSGCPEPSAEDDLVARRLKEAGKLMDITLHDFIIIGKSSYSYRQNGKLQ